MDPFAYKKVFSFLKASSSILRNFLSTLLSCLPVKTKIKQEGYIDVFYCRYVFYVMLPTNAILYCLDIKCNQMLQTFWITGISNNYNEWIIRLQGDSLVQRPVVAEHSRHISQLQLRSVFPLRFCWTFVMETWLYQMEYGLYFVFLNALIE